MSLDEQTHGEDIDWGEVRSACATRDWRRAWQAVGVDQAGPATPGEAYILSAARRVACVSAALVAWRGVALPLQTTMLRHVESASELETRTVRKSMARKLGMNEAWARIKAIAAWESSAKAQHVAALACPGALLAGFKSFSATINGQPIGMSSLPEQTFRAEYAGQWDESDTSPLEDLIRAANQPRMSGTLVMSRDVARQLRNLPELRTEATYGADPLDGLRYVTDAMAGQHIFAVPDLRPLTQAKAERAGLNPAPRGPAQRKRR